ncbi:MAG: putative Acetylornithine deacetylase/Succinyl-diaminopimelate desuccinylase [Verrucomicrobiaceae bacterium]|nr:putative Acetylornithine deacetylase/Succinyl-diaminopimelate desuccinylase [Verrucomicrobiaceae bacterium]
MADDELAQRLRDYLPTRLDEALGWLEKMVDINSFTSHAAGVNAVGRLTAECFSDLGFEAEMVPSEHADYGCHLFLSRTRPGAPRVVLVTHLDTVFPLEEELLNDFRWQPAPAEGRIYGPGTVDIKGGTVLIWLLLQGLRECVPQVFDNIDWLIAANASEEVRADDFAARTGERCREGAQAVLVFEGGPYENGEHHLVAARKGRTEYTVIAHGKAAHAGSAHAQGVNAIVALSEAVQATAKLTDYAADLTVNVGCIKGGTVVNRVPHEASFELEMRAFDPVVLAAAGDQLQALARPASEREAAIEVRCDGISPAWPHDERTQSAARHWLAAAQALAMPVKLVKRGGLSDANYLRDLGPTLDGLGPSGANAHCSERSVDGTKLPEYVDVPSFVPKATLNALAIVALVKEVTP